jgi:hypothetical protein
MANWIAGYWFARQLKLNFAHTPFSQERWEYFLGFGEHEITTAELIHTRGYHKVVLPLFDEFSGGQLSFVQDIIHSYRDQRVVFVAEQDQSFRDHFLIMEDLKNKFYTAPARKSDRLIYSRNTLNIAIHIRRGDVAPKSQTKNTNFSMRWQDSSYFINLLSTVLPIIQKPVALYLFSQADPGEFREFEKFKNIHFCTNMEPQDTFLHLVHADILMTSKSSFSYKPALLNNGIKICPRNFWHGYPETDDWILAEEDGTFDAGRLIKVLEKYSPQP